MCLLLFFMMFLFLFRHEKTQRYTLGKRVDDEIRINISLPAGNH
jgi:hypothetical protein